MLTKEQLLKEIETISEKDVESFYRIIEAWKRWKKEPTSFVEHDFFCGTIIKL